MGDTLRGRVGAAGHTEGVRIIFARLRDVVILCTIGRPILLTDWLELPDTIKCRVFGWLGVHSGLAEWCPGWCGCVDTGTAQDEQDAAAITAELAAGLPA